MGRTRPGDGAVGPRVALRRRLTGNASPVSTARARELERGSKERTPYSRIGRRRRGLEEHITLPPLRSAESFGQPPERARARRLRYFTRCFVAVSVSMDRSRPDWLDVDEYPFDPHYFKTDHGAMHYVDEGKGAPVIFVHGNPSWSFQFRHQIRRLSASNRCIAPDHIGFGLSDKPFDWDYLPQGHAEHLEKFLDSLDLSGITLVVEDWGGPIGLSYALRHPERVRNLVISNTWLWSVRRQLYYQMFSGLIGGPLGRYLIRKRNFFAKSIMVRTFGVKSRLTPKIHEQYLRPLGSPEDRKGCWVFPKQIVGASKWLSSLWDRREALAGKRILFAWGMRDIAFREKELNHWRRAFPNSQEVRYEDAGHFVSEEKPEELTLEIQRLLEAPSGSHV